MRGLEVEARPFRNFLKGERLCSVRPLCAWAVVLLCLCETITSQSCEQGKVILRRYPEALLCEPQLNSSKLFYLPASESTKGYIHATLSGFSAGIQGDDCRKKGLSFICSVAFAPCRQVKLSPGTPWPAMIVLPSLPCYGVCHAALEACRGTPLDGSLDCEPFLNNSLVVPSLNVTVPCPRDTPPPKAYRHTTPYCPSSLHWDPIEKKCGLKCLGHAYPSDIRTFLVLYEGWVMFAVALMCIYILPPLVHKAFSEPFFDGGGGGKECAVSGKLNTLFVFNLFVYCFSFVPYIVIPGEEFWCSNGVYGTAHDNAYVAVMGFCSVSGSLALRYYWFFSVVDVWVSIRLRKPGLGGPWLWTAIMISCFLLSYPISIYALIHNDIASVESLHPLALLVDSRTPNIDTIAFTVPLTVLSAFSLPFIFDICYVYWGLQLENYRSRIRVDRQRGLRLAVWCLVYEIPALLTVGYLWYTYARKDDIGAAYTEYIGCTIANYEANRCVNQGTQSVAWLLFINVFAITCYLPLGYSMCAGEKNEIVGWWRVVYQKKRLPKRYDESVRHTSGSSPSSSSNRTTSTRRTRTRSRPTANNSSESNSHVSGSSQQSDH